MQKSGTPASALKDLQRIPGVGPSLGQDLVDLGIRRVTALRRRSPERLYEQLCTLRGQHQDKCVLYVFRCAVYFASEQHHDPERLKWWNWKDAKPGEARLRC
jgi:pathogenicity locus Cdd1 protein